MLQQERKLSYLYISYSDKLHTLLYIENVRQSFVLWKASQLHNLQLSFLTFLFNVQRNMGQCRKPGLNDMCDKSCHKLHHYVFTGNPRFTTDCLTFTWNYDKSPKITCDPDSRFWWLFPSLPPKKIITLWHFGCLAYGLHLSPIA